MTLPVRTTVDDVFDVCGYLAKKPTGATREEARSVLDAKRLDGRKLSALKSWDLIIEDGDKLRVTNRGRDLANGDDNTRSAKLQEVVADVRPYYGIIERAHHRGEKSVSATDVAAHWHDHFQDQVADSDKTLNDQAVCFFQVADGAGLGKLVLGRKGSPTRFEFNQEAITSFLDGDFTNSTTRDIKPAAGYTDPTVDPDSATDAVTDGESPGLQHNGRKHGQGIFIAHGKNKKPLEQLKRILDQFKVPYRVAEEEPNLGRPISQKVREIMESCNCAILLFTADEQFSDSNGDPVWRPSENVVFELGAAGLLYGTRIVIMKEEDVSFPTNFRDLGYISFGKNQLEAKTIDVMKELIGFEILKVTT